MELQRCENEKQGGKEAFERKRGIHDPKNAEAVTEGRKSFKNKQGSKGAAEKRGGSRKGAPQRGGVQRGHKPDKRPVFEVLLERWESRGLLAKYGPLKKEKAGKLPKSALTGKRADLQQSELASHAASRVGKWLREHGWYGYKI